MLWARLVSESPRRECHRVPPRLPSPHRYAIDTSVSNTESMDVGLAYHSPPVGSRQCHEETPSS